MKKFILLFILLIFIVFTAGCEKKNSVAGVIRIVNNSGKIFEKVYLLPAGSSEEGENILDGSISAGSTKDFKTEVGIYNIKVETSDKSTAQANGIMIMKDEVYTYTIN